MNTLRVVVSAHVTAVAWGIGAALLLHPGYAAAGVAMVGTIVVLVVLNVVHPPAIATTLGFAFVAKQGQLVGLFLLALAMVAPFVPPTPDHPLVNKVATFRVRVIPCQASIPLCPWRSPALQLADGGTL